MSNYGKAEGRACLAPTVRVSHRTVDSPDADLAGENAGVAALIMDDQAAVGIDIGRNTGTAVIGHAAAQIDAEGLVTLPIGGKALGLIGVERTVKAEIRQILRQPLGVGGGIDRHTLQGKAGAMGQAGGIEIGLRLGKVDADAHHDAVAVGADLAQDADDFFAVQQKVVRPLDLAVDAVIGDLTGDDSKEQKGVFYCQYEIFKYIFRLYRRESQRIESKLSICLVSAVDSSKNELKDIKLLEKAMDKISFSISNSLRMRDVYTRYSRSQYLLLLLDADKSSFDGIEERIMTRFRRSKTMDSVNVKFDFKEI